MKVKSNWPLYIQKSGWENNGRPKIAIDLMHIKIFTQTLAHTHNTISCFYSINYSYYVVYYREYRNTFSFANVKYSADSFQCISNRCIGWVIFFSVVCVCCPSQNVWAIKQICSYLFICVYIVNCEIIIFYLL